jgi:hypothetical protein
MKRSHELGMVHPLLLTAIVLGVLTVGLGGFSVWAYLNYQDQKNNTDAKIEVAVSDAKREQAEADRAEFVEQEKVPTRQLTGPADLGQVKFSYPKTWSVYVDKEGGSGGSYEAYLHPLVVPPLASNTPYALRVTISGAKYESVLSGFNERIKQGQLKATPVTIVGVDGTRLDGAFSNTVRGSMVLFKIRDKTLQLYTQSNNFQGDFDNTVLKTLEFNK